MKQQAHYTFDVNVKRDALKHEDNKQRLVEFRIRQAVHAQKNQAPQIHLERVA